MQPAPLLDLQHPAGEQQITKQRQPQPMSSAAALSDAQPWTAARCQRLLRQLQSRLEALRKLHFKGCVESAERTKRSSRVEDESEESQRASKKIRYTYGQRRQSSSSTKAVRDPMATPPRSTRTLGTMKANHESPLSGQVVVPTPLWRRIRDHDSSPQPAPEKMACLLGNSTTSLPSKLLEQLAELKSSVPSLQFRIYEAIFHWLANLLRTTGANPHEPSRKSLLGMCLRKIPACVANIEAWERQVSKEKGNGSKWASSSASADMYGQLEGFGSKVSGWRPLKLVVVEHAMQLLSEAIRNGLLQVPFACLLGRLCAHFGRTEEASKLILSASGTMQATRPADDEAVEGVGSQALRVTVETVARTTTSGGMLGCLTNLMQEQRMSPSWFVSQGFKQSWLKGLELVTAGNGGPSAIDFLSTSMQVLSRKGNEGSSWRGKQDQTLASIASTVVAAALAMETRYGEGRVSKKGRGHRRLLYVLERSVRLARGHTRRRAHDSGTTILLLARQLALAGGVDPGLEGFKRQAEEELGRLTTADNAHAQTEYDHAVRLACSVAQCRRRTQGVAGPDAVAEVCAMLASITSRGWSGQALRSDVAFMVAQKTKDLRDLAHAESLAAAAEAQAEAEAEAEDATTTVFSGWRWEEGISEWVLSSDIRADASKVGCSGVRSATRSASRVMAATRRSHWVVSDEETGNKGARTESQNFSKSETRERYGRHHQHHDDRSTITDADEGDGILVSVPANRTRYSRRNSIHSGLKSNDLGRRISNISNVSSGSTSNTTSSNNTTSTSRTSWHKGPRSTTQAAGGRTKQPAYGSLSHGKENDCGKIGRRSISAIATGSQARRKLLHWSTTLAPSSQTPGSDSDWDELG